MTSLSNFPHQQTIFQQSTISDHATHARECFDLYQSQGLSEQTIQAFQESIYRYYNLYGRQFAWRTHITPYHVMVSEVMLQQTQTDRVSQKFDLFISRFPNFEALAQAPFHEVIKTWKGLGYNRRAMNLQKMAQLIVDQHNNQLPPSPDLLVNFKGIGKATAASICAFAFNQPTVFIETNIRTVFIYFFFQQSSEAIDDKLIMPLVEKTLDLENPRQWYYALMDYGVMLKKNIGNLCKLSKHYAKQSKFEGSDRQIRGMILQVLIDAGQLAEDELFKKIDREEKRIKAALQELIDEGFVIKEKTMITLK